MKTKYKDIAATLQIIGAVYRHPDILDKTDKYFFHEDDFVEPLHKVVFGAIHNLWKLGKGSVNKVDILNYLAVRPSAEAVFKAGNGEEWLDKVAETATKHQFDYYYNRLRKMTLLRTYEQFGIKLDFIYDPTNVVDLKKRQEQEDWLDSSSLEDITNAVMDELNEIRSTFVDNTDDNGYQAGEGALDLIERLKQTPEVGAPLYGSLVNTVTRGARLKKFYLRSAASGVGKAIPDDTLIPTPFGYRKVAEIEVGDVLFDRLGAPTKVLAVHPQKEKKEIIEITFADGRVAKCCNEHLWLVNIYGNSGKITQTMTTKALLGIYHNECEISIPGNHAVEFYPPPVRTIDASLLEKIRSGEMTYLPYRAMISSIEDRTRLLSNLLEVVDGFIMSFASNHKGLTNDVAELARSLGYKVLPVKPIGRRYEIRVDTNPLNNKEVKILTIKRTHQYAKMTCFTVDNPESLFLMNNFIVTHNTRSMVADSCYIACDKIYDSSQGQWIDIGESLPTLLITTEQELDEIQTMMLAFVSNVNEEKILTGCYEPEEEERVLEAARILQRSPLYVEELPDFSMQDIENVIRRHIRENDVSYFFFDYIHSSMKIFAEITQKTGGVKLREDQILLMMAIRLKDLCNELGIFICSATQLNGDWEHASEANQNLLRGAKALADKVDWGGILLNATKQDMEGLQTILESGAFPTPKYKLSVYKNRRGQYKSVIVWMDGDLGTCRLQPLFITDNQYAIIPTKELNIKVVNESAF